jgi:hypothetical protein
LIWLWKLRPEKRKPHDPVFLALAGKSLLQQSRIITPTNSSTVRETVAPDESPLQMTDKITQHPLR